MTYSALAMACSFTVRHCTIFTGSPRSAPAMDNSLKPSGVVGGSTQEHTDTAGSTPMDTEIGRG